MLPTPIPASFSECAFNSNKASKGDEVCAPASIVKVIAKVVGADPNAAPVAIIDKARDVLKCASESCVVSSAPVAGALGSATVAGVKQKYYKPFGPKDLSWLSNVDIDTVAEQWMDRYDKYVALPYAMLDFAQYQHPLVTLQLADLYAKGVRCFSSIMNTDLSTGPGKHWTAIFCDMRCHLKWSFEFFNSTGRRYPQPLSYLEMLKEQAQVMPGAPDNCEVVAVCDVQHQTKNSECGVYSLYYIWSRLEGAPYASFNMTRIPDDAMHAFRDYLYRDTK